MTNDLCSKIVGYIFTALAILYFVLAAWVQWGTSTPRDWKSPLEIILIGLFWSLLAYVFLSPPQPRE